MLAQLHIENIAIIDSVDINFNQGLNILTGETGAGKSIIIDSINIILGERISRKIIRSGTEKGLVEALFYIESEAIKDILSNYGIQQESDNALLISKEITTTSKSTCRINGRIVTSSMLKDIGKLIVNIHGQHDNQDLLQTDKHVMFLDKYAGSELLEIKKQYHKTYQQVKELKIQIEKTNYDEREKERTIDLLKFQLEEIEGAQLKDGEEEELTESRDILINGNKIITAISNAYDNIYSGNQKEISIHDIIAETLKELSEIKHFDSELNSYYTTLENINFELDELVHEIRNYRDNYEYDPSLIETTEQRLDLIFNLKRKYGSSIEEILKYGLDIKEQLEKILYNTENIKQLNEQLIKATKQLEILAGQMYVYRLKIATRLEEKIIEELQDLDMEKVKFKVDIQKTYDKDGKHIFLRTGYDKVEFLISTNVGEPLKPLSQIASGGEMSRIILAIKTIIADIDEVGTLIFDEIDIGVSGRAAQKIAEKLSNIAMKKQVLCITHLPQIASMADNQYLIEKGTINNKAITTVRELEKSERKKELARIIGGAEITELTLKHAEEMINIANKLKNIS